MVTLLVLRKISKTTVYIATLTCMEGMGHLKQSLVSTFTFSTKDLAIK